jgi:hypothetical protein
MLRTPTWLKAIFITGYKPTQDDFTDVFDSFVSRGIIRAAGAVSATGEADQSITFQFEGTPSPLSSSNYALKTDDHGAGLGIEVTQKTAAGFVITSIEPGEFDYIAILNT